MNTAIMVTEFLVYLAIGVAVLEIASAAIARWRGVPAVPLPDRLTRPLPARKVRAATLMRARRVKRRSVGVARAHGYNPSQWPAGRPRPVVKLQVIK